MQITAHHNSNIMSVNMPVKVKSGLVTTHNFGSKKIGHSQAPKKVIADCVEYLVVIFGIFTPLLYGIKHQKDYHLNSNHHVNPEQTPLSWGVTCCNNCYLKVHRLLSTAECDIFQS